MGSRLEIYTLGQVAIRLAGRPLTNVRSRTAEALLIYLVQQQRPLPRQQLADFFWDDRSPKQALANLRAILSMLRPELADYLFIDRHTVAFNSAQDFWLDTAVFSHLLTANNRSSDIPHLKKALDLYQGDFLTGFYLSESRGFEE